VLARGERRSQIEDRLGPRRWKRVMEFINPRLDQPRVMARCARQFDDVPEGASYVFFRRMDRR